MRYLKKSIGYVFLIVAIWTFFSFYVRDRYTVPILMYHRVDSFGASGELNVVSQNSFEHQMKFLKKHGYQVISLEDLVQGINKGVLFNRHSVVITFDDGYEDNYTKAFPVIKKYDFPAIIFVISDFIGNSGFMTWEQLKEMQDFNIAVGSHTRHHVYLPGINEKGRLEDEIFNSKKIIEKNLGKEVDYFSYPSGGYSEEIKDLVKSAKYKGACATNRGFDRFNTEVYELKRIRINDHDNAVVMWAKLSGYYNLFRDIKTTH